MIRRVGRARRRSSLKASKKTVTDRYLSNQTTVSVCPSGIWSGQPSRYRQFSIEVCGTQSPWSSISGSDRRTDRRTVVMHFKWQGSLQRRLQRRMCRLRVVLEKGRTGGQPGRQTNRQTAQRNLSFRCRVGVAGHNPPKCTVHVVPRLLCGAVYICHSCGFQHAAFCFCGCCANTFRITYNNLLQLFAKIFWLPRNVIEFASLSLCLERYIRCRSSCSFAAQFSNYAREFPTKFE